MLTKKQQQELRAQAHHLEPIVQIGHQGLHAAAFAAVSRALRDHELIKVRLHEPEDKRQMAQELAAETGATLCGLVGHTVILYKQKPKPKEKQPATRSEQRETKRPAKRFARSSSGSGDRRAAKRTGTRTARR